MTEENKRGAVRAKPDPMALKTKGRVTTYESLSYPGVGLKVRPKSARLKVRMR